MVIVVEEGSRSRRNRSTSRIGVIGVAEAVGAAGAPLVAGAAGARRGVGAVMVAGDVVRW